MAETLALAREEQIWCVTESAAGTQTDPAATDVVLPISLTDLSQQVETLMDEQVRNSRSRFSNITGRTMPGTFQISCYCKSSDALGTPPEADTLLKSAFGVQTINASTSVVYSLSSSAALPTMTILRKLGHHVMVARGAVVDKVDFAISGKEVGKATFSGVFMEMARASEDTVGTGGIDNSATTLPVTNGDRFYIPSGMFIYAQIDNEVVKVTARSGNNLTIVRAQKTTSAASHTAGAAITFWDPGSTELGTPIHGKAGAVTIDAVTTVLLDLSISLENNVHPLIDEKNGAMVWSNFTTPGKRKVTIESGAYLRASDNRDFADSLNQTTFAFIAALGTTSTKIWEFSAPTAVKHSPAYSGSEEVEKKVTFDAIAAVGSADSELTLTIK